MSRRLVDVAAISLAIVLGCTVFGVATWWLFGGEPSAASVERVEARRAAAVERAEARRAAKRAADERSAVREAHGMVVATCHNAVRSRLRSPSTAEFPRGYTGHVQTEGDGHTYAHYVDAQNAYGGTVRTQFVCSVIAVGDRYVLHDLVMLD